MPIQMIWSHEYVSARVSPVSLPIVRIRVPTDSWTGKRDTKGKQRMILCTLVRCLCTQNTGIGWHAMSHILRQAAQFGDPLALFWQ